MKQNIVKKTKEKHEKFTVITIILLALLILYTISLLIPVGWGFISAFKDNRTDFRTNIIGLPKKWVWNFSTVYESFSVDVATKDGQVKIDVPTMFLYGFLYAIGCAFAGTFIPCLTAYLCARFDYKFSKVIYTVVIVTMILPIVGSMPSEIRVAKALGLFDTMWGAWLMKANFLGMYFLVFYAIFKAMPMAYSEAAKIDGAGNWTILFRIALPIVRNTFFTVLLVTFINFWNDYQTPLVYLPSYPTISRGMYELARSNDNKLSSIPMRMAGAMMMLVPIFIVFLCFQKRLLGNLTVGGIKG